MITAKFFVDDGNISGFEVKGHSTPNGIGNDIVCAAVSSAVYMTANTVTEILHLNADIKVDDDGYLYLKICDDISSAQSILKGLRLHLEGLANDYPNNISVIRRCQNA